MAQEGGLHRSVDAVGHNEQTNDDIAIVGTGDIFTKPKKRSKKKLSAAKRRLEKTGRMSDAAAVFEELMKGD